ncbi:phosphoenolpyruvate--protein phosphotransferase [Sphingomonas sp.]|uniref:phosphoenolpyruvate--protein phosphotransferase n=1 Tax=Sphingomonas sp. TaxID=28214 RepID=UPI003B3A55EC
MSEIVLHAPFAGWLAPLDAVPDPVFAERMMGDGVAIDPIEGVLRAPADGQIVSVPASAHAVTMRLDNGVELLIHIGLETVALAGEGFIARVAGGARVRAGDALIDFDLDRVGRGAKDLITPIVIASEGARLSIDAIDRVVRAGEPIARVAGARAETVVSMSAEVATRILEVVGVNGIHARPAARIGALLKAYTAQVMLHHGARSADARSTVALLALGARQGDCLRAEARGPDAEAVLEALAAFARDRFGDDAADAVATTPTSTAPGGVCASPGLAVGQVLQFRPAIRDVPRDGEGIAQERAALADAIGVAASSLGRGDIADAHRALLDDPALDQAAQRAIADGRSAAFAWRSAVEAAAQEIERTGDAMLIERVADLRDIEQQVIAVLLGEGPAAAPKLTPGTILIAHDLLPSQFQALDRTRLSGICTAAGGPTAHVAILAASAGVPMVVAAGAAVLGIPDGRTVVLDADAGTVDDDPGVGSLAQAESRIADRRTARAAAIASAHEECRMADGTRIEVFANLGSVDDASVAIGAGAEGCGLLRTEFLFLDRETAPDEEEQTALYRQIATTLGSRPLIVRTLDIGGDKPVPYLPQQREDNPALGQRGIRLGLARPDLLMTQLRAILRGVPGDQCRIMLPMIVDANEVAQVRALLREAMAQTGRADPVQLGVMIETPAAAMLADQIAVEADFLSIGTNDLTQYTLACDRTNAAVSAKVDALHPAVLRLIGQAARGGAAHGRWTGVCGGLASDPLAASLLVGLGVTELSATPAIIPTLKAAVRGLTMDRCREVAERACAAHSPEAVRAILTEDRP